MLVSGIAAAIRDKQNFERTIGMEEKVVEENGEKYLTVETLRSFGVRQQFLFMSTQNILFLQISVQKTFGFVLLSLNHTFCWTRKSFCRCVMISKLRPAEFGAPISNGVENYIRERSVSKQSSINEELSLAVRKTRTKKKKDYFKR